MTIHTSPESGQRERRIVVESPGFLGRIVFRDFEMFFFANCRCGPVFLSRNKHRQATLEMGEVLKLELLQIADKFGQQLKQSHSPTTRTR